MKRDTAEKPITIIVKSKAHRIHGKIYAQRATVILKGGFFRTLKIFNDVVAHKIIKKRNFSMMQVRGA